MPFSNVQVDLDSLPGFDEVELRELDPRYAPLVLGITLAVEAAALLAGAVVLALDPAVRAALTAWPGLAVPLGALGLAALLAWFAHKAASVKRFAVREHDVIVHSGVFFKRQMIQPIRRIQHVEQVQGPVARRFGLYKIRLFSAGTGQFAFEIPGLDAATAARLRQSILSLRESKLAAAQPAPGAAAHEGAASALEPAGTDDG